jgi:hypothetical protein
VKGEMNRSRLADPTAKEIRAIRLWLETISPKRFFKIYDRAIDQGITLEKSARPAWMNAKKRMAGGF